MARVGGTIFSKAVQIAFLETNTHQAGALENNAFDANRLHLLELVSSSVSDVMGSTADLSNSSIIALVAAFVIGTELYGQDGIALPLYLTTIGVFSSLFALSLVALLLRYAASTNQIEAEHDSVLAAIAAESAKESKILSILRSGYVLGTIMYLVLSYEATMILHFQNNMYYCVLIGHLGGSILSLTSEISAQKDQIAPILGIKLEESEDFLDFESEEDGRRASVENKQRSGLLLAQEQLKHFVRPLSAGLLRALLSILSSSVAPVLVIFAILLWCAYMADTFGVVIAGVSFMSNCMFSIAYSVVFPILANSHSFLTLTKQTESILFSSSTVQQLGATVSNTVKGFASGAASVVSFCLFVAFASLAGVGSIDLISDPSVLPGLLLGAMVPFLFSGLTLTTITSVSSRISHKMKETLVSEMETDQQFLALFTDFGLSSAMWHLLVPATFAISLTESVLYFFGIKVLAGFVAGAIVSGLIMATTLTTAGVAMQGEEERNAAIFSGTLRDAGGPSINMLTKLICVASIILVAQKSWALFLLVVIVLILVTLVYTFNIIYSGRASFDLQELSHSLQSEKETINTERKEENEAIHEVINLK